VSDRACPKTWTCQIVLADARLPNLKMLRDGLREGVGNLFTIRGVEAVVEGTLVRKDNRAVLRLPERLGELEVAVLKRKVQYDPKAQREEPATPDEREAHARLLAQWDGQPRTVRITGPLTQPNDDGLPAVLEVRLFEWKLERGE
jgi:hypothetical protein